MRFDHSLSAVASVVGLGLVSALLFGCGQKPSTVGVDKEDKVAADPWPRLVTSLRKENDSGSARRILSQLNTELATAAKEHQPDSLQPADEAACRDLVKLTDDELKEIRGATFTNLDSQYLAECLYVRDAARSLDVAKSSPTEQARVAFDWVCRQVVLSPWLLQVNEAQRIAGVVPPSAVLRRGSGSGLERAYVFLAVLQQLGVDGCLIGPPDARTAPASKPFAASEKQAPKGPFWAVGARDGANVVLFDPWGGDVLIANGRAGTLADVKANPDLVKAWGVSAEDAKASLAYLAVPLTSMAPRMQKLEVALKADTATRLALNPKVIHERFVRETRVADAPFWNPPNDNFDYTRVLGWFLPAEEGGFAPSGDYYGRYQAAMLPLGVFAVPEEVLPRNQDDVGVPEVVQQVRLFSLNAYGGSFLANPSPRERIQRGQFAEVTRSLVDKRKDFYAAAERVRTDKGREQSVKAWAERGREVFNNLSRAKEKERTQPGALAAAQADVENFWKQSAGVTQAVVDLAVGDAGLAEATYLLALAMHEQAIRDQARAERVAADPTQKAAAEKARSKAADSWAEAKSWWETYAPLADGQDKTYPGRAAHSRRLAEQAKSNTRR